MKARWRILGIFCWLFSAGCSAAQPPERFVPAGEPATAAARRHIHATLTIRVPKKRRYRRLHPAYVSPATQSLAIVVTAGAGGQTVYNRTVDLTPSSPGCTAGANGTTCTVPVYLAAGSYVGTLTAYAGLGGAGAPLSQAQDVPFTIVPAQANQIGFTLGGIPASIVIAPESNAIAGSMAPGFTIGARGVWGNAQSFALEALDASGFVIAGPGAPALSASSSNDAFTLSSPSPSLPNVVSLAPPADALSATTQLTASAQPADSSWCAGSSNPCSATTTVRYAPFAADDWITFAHDFQRTAFQAQDTGITTANVAQLAPRWTRSIGGTFLASPIVYNGNVIVVRGDGTIYDLSASTGKTVWSAKLPDIALETPTIDVDHGLLFAATYANADDPAKGQTGLEGPSGVYAYDLATGNLVWQQTLPGVIRAASVYANGVLYEASAGGDEYADCGNGGVHALSATTGAIEWNWFTNPFTNPGGGGGVWSSMAWDGSHVIFGTGNTCQPVADMQGAAALNPDGSLAWSFSAEPDAGDYDTGGGVMVRNGGATFINKDGSLYTVDVETGEKLLSTPLGATGDNGGFASPATDGSIVVIGAGDLTPSASGMRRREACRRPNVAAIRAGRGTDGASASGTISALKAVSPTGTILWSFPMNNALIGYVAVNNGIVFAGLDSGSAHDVDALDIHSGALLAQFAGAKTFWASPAVVPSGVYAIDGAGTVYALTLPASVLQAGAAKLPGLSRVPLHSAVRSRRALESASRTRSAS